MRATVPSIHCDVEEGCDTWDVDFYETSASSVGGVRITATRRAPGWTSTEHSDFCPQHPPQQRCAGCGHYEGDSTAPDGCITGTNSHHYIPVGPDGMALP